VLQATGRSVIDREAIRKTLDGKGLLKKEARGFCTPVAGREKSRLALTESFGLGFMRHPAAYCLTYHEIIDSVTVSSPKGDIYRKGKVRRPFKGVKPRVEYLDDIVPIKHYEERVAKLSYLLKLISEHGLHDNVKTIRRFQRLLFVCFTTHITNVRMLVRRLARECYPDTATKIRSRSLPERAKRLREKPSFTGEMKTHEKVGIKVPLWTFRPRYGNYPGESHLTVRRRQT